MKINNKRSKTNHFNQKGITLIALVITIVVLLILAGVSINAIFSENGIINRAKETQNKMNEAEEKEKISICVMGARLGDKGYQELTVENLQSSISSAFKDKVTNVISNGDDSFTVTIKDTEERKYTVDSDGTISLGEYDKWDGKSSTEPTEKTTNEIHIYTTSELKWLADQVNNEGNTFEGYTIYLENNLDLGAREKDGNWETTENEEVKWTAIGKEKAKILQATFEGNNHIIKGVYVNDSTNYNGIFGNTNSILNLTVKNSYIKGASHTGGIVGALRSGTMENCHNVNTQVILIEGEYNTCGGVVGQVTGNIKNCSNTGTVTGLGVNANGRTQCGGIAGTIALRGTIENCKNIGKIFGNGFRTGGIVGIVDTSSTVTNCHNAGTVTGQDYTGGIAGYANQTSNCNNTGTVTGQDYIGGIAGVTQTSGTVTNCHNAGTVTGQDYIGGIVGTAQNIVTKCSNTGTISGEGTGGTGGIVGSCAKGIPQNVSLCYNSGTVTAKDNAGGISGYLGAQEYAATETKCYNKGEIKCTEGTIYGEIIGKMAYDSTVTKCFYLNKNKSIFGVGAINEGGDLEEQRKGAQPTNVDLKSYDEFIKWIENQ